MVGWFVSLSAMKQKKASPPMIDNCGNFCRLVALLVRAGGHTGGHTRGIPSRRLSAVCLVSRDHTVNADTTHMGKGKIFRFGRCVPARQHPFLADADLGPHPFHLVAWTTKAMRSADLTLWHFAAKLTTGR